MKHNFTLVFLCIIILLGGCKNSDHSSEEFKESMSQIESRIVDVEKTIMIQQETIDNQKELLQSQESQIEELGKAHNLLQLSVSNTEINTQIVNDLVHQTIDYRTALLDNAAMNGEQLELTITFADFVQDPEAPNGFHLDESEEGKTTLSISKAVPIYWLDKADGLIPKEIEFRELVGQKGFIRLYEDNKEVVFIYEVYIP